MMLNYHWLKKESKFIYLCSSSEISVVSFSYKHAIDGLFRVYNEEGFRKLYNGGVTATTRGLLMTVGQISVYDQVCLLSHFK